MNENYVLVPGAGDDNFVPLARSQKGKLFKKQILPMNGDFTHPSAPGKMIHIDEQFAKRLKENFKSNVNPIVQVPIVNDANQHVEDPLRNAGEVVDLTYDDKGVYAIIDARKHAEDFGTTLLGASALMHLDYEDTRDGQRKGPTLLHVAVTNRPHITDLGDFEELIAASAGNFDAPADTSGEKPVVLIPATNTEDEMDPKDLEQVKAVLKDEHGIDLDALQEKVETGNTELLAALSNVISPEKEVTPSGDLTVKDVADAVIELAEERVALSAQVAELRQVNEQSAQEKAEREVDDLIAAGRILPKQRDVMVALSRTDREKFDALVPDDSIVALSAQGVDTFDAPEKSEKYNEAIERLSALANESTK